jgi:hypothetical protein
VRDWTLTDESPRLVARDRRRAGALDRRRLGVGDDAVARGAACGVGRAEEDEMNGDPRA